MENPATPYQLPFKRLGGYLEGQFLIASPQLQDPYFGHTVVYVCLHSEEGAMGVIINRIIPTLPFRKIAKQLDIELAKDAASPTVHFGGPVNPQQGFVLHSGDYDAMDSLRLDDGIYVNSSRQILHDIVGTKGPEHYHFTLGFAGWDAGQIEKEIESNSWLTVPASFNILFKTPMAERWEKAAQSLGFDIYRLSPQSGHA